MDGRIRKREKDREKREKDREERERERERETTFIELIRSGGGRCLDEK